MLDLPRQMYRNAPSTTLSTLATVPAGVVWVVRNIVMANTTASAASVTLNFANFAIVPALSIGANSVVTLDVAQVLTPGSIIQGSVSTVGIHLSIAGIEVVA